MIGTLHFTQRGASMWMAHANESNTCVVPPIATSNALSYEFPQTSQLFIRTVRCKHQTTTRAQLLLLGTS